MAGIVTKVYYQGVHPRHFHIYGSPSGLFNY